MKLIVDYYKVIHILVGFVHLLYYSAFYRTGVFDGIYIGPTAFVVSAIIAGNVYEEDDSSVLYLYAILPYCILFTIVSKLINTARTSTVNCKPALNRIFQNSWYVYTSFIFTIICTMEQIHVIGVFSYNHTMDQLITLILRRLPRGIIVAWVSTSMISDSIILFIIQDILDLNVPQMCQSAGYKHIITDVILSMIIITNNIDRVSVGDMVVGIGMLTIYTVIRFIALQRSTSNSMCVHKELGSPAESNQMIEIKQVSPSMCYPASNTREPAYLLQTNPSNGTNNDIIQILIEPTKQHHSYRSDITVQQNHYYAIQQYHGISPQHYYASQQKYSFERQQNTATLMPLSKPQSFHSPQNDSNRFIQQDPYSVKVVPDEQFIYPMKSHPRGICVIINNEMFTTSPRRFGTGRDANALANLFHELGFVTDTQYPNKTHTEMRHILNDVAAMDHDKYDCLIVAILTHGDYGDVLYGTTGGRIVIQEVIETFTSKRCPTFTGKPKIFIIQACRGRRHNQTVQLNDTNDDECDMIDSGPTMHPNTADYLVAYSTIPGHVSLRNNKNGSIFISTLVKIFGRYAAYEDLATMLERVTNEVTKYKPLGDGSQDSRQSPEVRTCLRGKLYFNAGN